MLTITLAAILLFVVCFVIVGGLRRSDGTIAKVLYDTEHPSKRR